MTAAGEIVAQHVEHLPSRAVDKVLGSFESAIDHFVKGGIIAARSDLLAIGVSAPGECDTANGIVKHVTNFPGWSNVPLATFLTKITSRPCVLANDGDAACVGEWWSASLAAARDNKTPIKNLCLITLGTGVGCGIVDNGTLIAGMGMAAEYGHIIVVDAEDPVTKATLAAPGPRSPHFLEPLMCGCGQLGCLEVFCSAAGMVRMAVGKARDIAAGIITLPWAGTTADSPFLTSIIDRASAIVAAGGDAAADVDATLRCEVKCEHIFNASRASDPYAMFIEDTVARLLSVAVLNLVRTVDTQYIAIGGGASLAGGRVFVEKIKAGYTKRTWRFKRHEVAMEPAKMGNDAGFYGMAKLALDRFSEGNNAWSAHL